jgi:adenylate kinase
MDIFQIDSSVVEYVIKTLKYQQQGTVKTLILISSIRVWAQTPKKVKREGEEMEDDVEEEGDADDDEEPGEPEPEPEPVLDDNGEPKEPIEYAPLRERDFILRRTYSVYRKQKALETLALSAGKSKESLNSYVLCTGLRYGMGEEELFPVFKV